MIEFYLKKGLGTMKYLVLMHEENVFLVQSKIPEILIKGRIDQFVMTLKWKKNNFIL